MSTSRVDLSNTIIAAALGVDSVYIALHVRVCAHVYDCSVDTNAASVKLELNGQPLDGGSVVHVPFFGQATFNVTYAPGNLTAKCMDSSGKILSSYSVASLAGPATSMKLSLDAPSASTGTGTHLVADGEDVAMVRAALYDSAGNFAYNATDNVTFSVVSGPGKIWVRILSIWTLV